METIFSTWPVYAFLFLVFFVIIFYRPLSNFIGRTKSITSKGIETTSDVERQVKEQAAEMKKNDESEKKTVEIFSDILLNAVVDKFPFIKKREEEITKDLNKLNIPVSGKEPFLIKILSITLVSNDCEIIYREIFGSQIRMLIFLNGNQSIGKTFDDLKPFYLQYSNGNEEVEKNYPYMNYLAWLLWKDLIMTKDDKLFYISDKGQFFLNHIVSKGYNVNRLG